MTVSRSWGADRGVVRCRHTSRQCRSGVFDEDFAVQVSHSDFLAVDDHQDLFETAPAVDLIANSGEDQRAGAGQGRDGGAGRELGGRRPARCGDRWKNRRVEPGARRVNLGDCLPRRARCDTSGQPLVGTFVVVDVVEHVDLGLQLDQRAG